jgi:CheY-like chemotaxis protein
METGTDRPNYSETHQEGFDVVLVEDNPDVINQLKVAFRHDPAVFVQVFLDPFAALTWLHAQQYNVDAIITDISMPEKSGRQLTEEIRENEHLRGRPRPIEIFWYTGYGLDLNDPDSEFGKTFQSARVRKVYTKATHTPVMVINDVVEILKKDAEETSTH